MRIAAIIVGLGLFACEDDARAPRASDYASESSAPSAGDPNDLPNDWRWVTVAEQGYVVAFPGLPIHERTADGSEPFPLVVRKGASWYSVRRVTMPMERLLADARQALGGDPRAREIDGTTRLEAPGGVVLLHPSDEGTYLVVGMSSSDGARFVDTFAPIEGPQPGSYTIGPEGPRVRSPCRLGPWSETSATPPIHGHMGLLDGVQLAAHYADLPGLVVPPSALEDAVEGMVGSMQGSVLARSDDPHQGRPSRRVTFRAGDGMHATVRMALVGRRLYQVAAYAPSGQAPAWAAAFVDSLTF